MKVSDYIAERCIETGIQDVFLVTGGGAMHLNDALGREERIKYICNLQDRKSVV